jgi:hypothetical protein
MRKIKFHLLSAEEQVNTKKPLKKGANTAAKMFSRNEYFKTTEIRFLLACNQTVHFIYVFAK